MMNSVDENSERFIREALDSLHLPQMPTNGAPSSHVLRILVVADLDLPSASALAEYTLQQSHQASDTSSVDLCIACGSFAREEDLLPYLRGKQARRQSERQSTCNETPFLRSREETAALEGLMTAALSQLESIVCRVIYCPGSHDPVTSLFTDRTRRLTPNSRNVHQQWLPLAPGIGCAALLYVDSAEAHFKTTAPHWSDKATFNSDQDDASDGHDDDEDEEHFRKTWSDKWLHIHRALNSVGYCQRLEGLIQLAPPPSHPVPFTQSVCQTILVTHYVDCSLERESKSKSLDFEQQTLSFTQPWPKEAHASFLKSAVVQKLMCLEIASGSAAKYMPELIEQGNSQVLLPGSLRERGEFCILEIALLEDERATDGAAVPFKDCPEEFKLALEREYRVDSSSTPSTSNHIASAGNIKSNVHRAFAWKVQKVDFHRLSQARDRV